MFNFPHVIFSLGDGVCNPVGHRMVVRQKQQSGSVKIEPAHGADKLPNLRNQRVDGGPPFWILVSGDETFGFVQQHVDALLPHDRFGVERDAVALGVDPMVVRLDHGAIDGDAALEYPLARLSARADPGL